MSRKFLGLGFIKKILSFLKSHKKVSIISTLLIIVFSYLLIPRNNNPVLTADVSRKDITKTVSITGDIFAEKNANLSFQTSETLSYLGVSAGDNVKKGQEIAAVNTSKLTATVRQAQQDFIAAKAASEKYYDNHNDTESFQEKVTRTAIDDTQNKAYDQLLKAQYDLSHSALYAPFDGIVTRLDADVAGENISPLTIFTITDPTSLKFRMEVDQADIGKVNLGQNVDVSLDSFPDKQIKLKVESIDFVSHKTSSGGNAFYVKASLPSSVSYRPGMSGNADIITDFKKNVLSVPSSSIAEDTYVYLKKGDKFEKTKILKGIDDDIDAEIISGLSEGEAVALDSNSVPQNLKIQ